MTALMTGCDGPQSTLTPNGPAAENILNLFWWMLSGGTVIWLSVVLLAFYAIVLRRGQFELNKTRFWIIGGGVVMPTAVLTVLLIYGLSLLPPLIAEAPPGSLTVEVDGVRWWWRVRYQLDEKISDGGTADGGTETEYTTVETANEIRLPTGEPIQFLLRSDDVIHSFWIPALGGKVDMIPGRTNRLMLEADAPAHVRGVCAEYCGDSHAVMNFDVVTVEPEEFQTWLDKQRQPANRPTNELQARGETLFLSNGCGACHTVRGTPAHGPVGPDLTHFGSRKSIGADMMPNTVDNLADWISKTDDIKPGVEMPAFDALSDEELHAIASYLKGLE